MKNTNEIANCSRNLHTFAMPQRDVWEREYLNPKLIVTGDEPQKDLKKFLKFLRRKEDTELTGLAVVDLGSGTGKNANYLASLGNHVTGIEIARNAIEIADERAKDEGINVTYLHQSFGEPLPFPDASVDLVLDIMSSNSLNEEERALYLRETHRILKPNGHMFVRGLCKDGDKNTKNMLKLHPGEEYDTYVNTEMGLTERVFGEADFRTLYGAYFTILELEKKSNYARFNGTIYKRNYWLCYLKKS